jgi:hypothetical protein
MLNCGLASASGTASTAAPIPSPPSADPARSPRTSGASSPTPARSSASERSSPSPGQPGLNHAADQLDIRNAILTSQVRQLETTVGTALPRAGPDGRLTLTAYGERFARDVRPALESLAQSRKSKSDNHGTLCRPPPGIVHLPGNQATESCSTTTKHPAHGVQVHVIPTVGIGFR